MSTIKRDIDSIAGLRDILQSLESNISSLTDRQLTPTQREELERLIDQLNDELGYFLTNLHLSDAVYEAEDDEKVATVKAIREYVLGALQATGPQLTLERLTVNDQQVHLSHRPINGREGLLNFARCLFIDENGQETLYRMSPTESEYTFSLQGAPAFLNGSIVEVQYFHYHDPRDLNDIIGQLILDGLVLVTPQVSE